ncbi:hypothetical protein PUNSTDRAFT_129579 [Punctularia strigosozonata HHB-11173 SS5]|uniref:uncharacterized protein n=1 Tax=Punctularia strigosozonata (strain HHB-11173) TaxID=741275 RepID=UPI0004416A3C|nr:uncharacterized protein PUNSTDRAFT_129579 [Punctularia strigosozonata HHB-11173 SS5]EIN13915.1 hypothetical protein PUNSTDRAFT_129579 [Punctularia strigosozonata HHB-11173 SS5]
MVLIEVCVDSLESAIRAFRGGADRLELCANLGLGGGTTPSLGLFNAVHRALPAIPIMVMIRPRVGDFCYSSLEFDVMIEDIKLFRKAGATGVVAGVLAKDGAIDVARMRTLTAQAGPGLHSLQAVQQIPGITRILTSGHGLVAPSEPHALSSLLAFASTMTILPGSGINAVTVGPLLDALLPYGLREIHLSGGGWVDNGTENRKPGFGMGIGESEWGVWKTDEEKVRAVKRIVEEKVKEFESRGPGPMAM